MTRCVTQGCNEEAHPEGLRCLRCGVEATEPDGKSRRPTTLAMAELWSVAAWIYEHHDEMLISDRSYDTLGHWLRKRRAWQVAPWLDEARLTTGTGSGILLPAYLEAWARARVASGDRFWGAVPICPHCEGEHTEYQCDAKPKGG